jgi:outer membrane receptor protein involved in Fe transport
LEKNMANALLRRAISQGLRTSGTIGMSTLALGFAASAIAQDAGQDAATQKLDTITVTGSNIRRVDIETSNPVITVDRAEIQKSGKLTVGDLLQQLPTIAGAANNPNVNNGGGTGGSFISLRGLGTNRSLILVDGKRVINPDVNAIPSVAIERIEVLTDGASAVYGSDAIAGVVNIILRKDYQGAEIQMNYGISDHDDGARRGFSIAFGQTSDKGSVVGGLDYNKTDQILAGHRAFSEAPLYFLRGAGNAPYVTPVGSVASPGGSFTNFPQFANCSYYGYGTFDPSAPGGDGIPEHYRCFRGPGDPAGAPDAYNFQTQNLITTPQERTNFFLNGSYKLTDSIEAYMEVFHNATRTAGQGAEVPLIFSNTGLTMSADNPYNPFGVDIGAGAGASPNSENVQIRLKALGPRVIKFQSDTDQARLGVRGSLFGGDWQYDLWGNYGHFSGLFQNLNYLNASAMEFALSGDCTLPTPGVPVTAQNCLNLFDQNDPNTAYALKNFYSLNSDAGALSTSRQGGLDVNGSLFDLPAGTVSMAAGANYRKFYVRNYHDTVRTTDPTTGTCPAGSSSLCATPFTAGYNVKEAYAEVFVPVLRDLPFVHSLNITGGDRWSKYSTFGSTNNWKLAVEYRPIEDLLVRGTVSAVFRAPNTTESFAPVASSFDPYTRGPGEPRSTNGAQIETVFSGASVGGYPLKPENGKSFDFGVVYDPQWLPGLSVSADLWRIYLLNNIVRPTGQNVVDICYANGSYGGDSNPYCALLQFAGDSIQTIKQLTYQNLGRLDATGVDFGGVYKLPETAFGNFTVGLNATYLSKYNNASAILGVDDQVAGTYNNQYGSFPRWRAMGSIGWQMGDFSATWQQRLIGREKNTAGQFAFLPGHFLPIGAVVYHNVSFGYNIQPINTRIDVGIDNVGDKQPPLFYQSVTNANIDINTYDPIGRYYRARVTVKF